MKIGISKGQIQRRWLLFHTNDKRKTCLQTLMVFIYFKLRYCPVRNERMYSLIFLTLSQTSPVFYVSEIHVFWKHWEKEKLLITFPHNDTFWHPWETSLLKTLLGKGEIARNVQFLLFPQCFLPVWKTFCHFQQIWNYHLQTLSVWKSLKFVVWERVNPFIMDAFENVRKVEKANNKHFLPSHNVFYASRKYL